VKIHESHFAWSHFAWMIENVLFFKLIIVKGSDSAKMIIYKLYHLHASQHFIHLEKKPIAKSHEFSRPIDLKEKV